MSATTFMVMKVLKETKKTLIQHKIQTGLSTGEVVDRVILNFAVPEPEIAAILITEQFVMITKNQTEEQKKRSILITISILANALFNEGMSGKKLLDEIRSIISEDL